MPIKLRNRGRSPLTLELTSLGEHPQTDKRFGRDPATGATGLLEIQRSYPAAVTIPGRGESEELPDAVASDPAVLARTDVVVVPAKSSPPADAPKEP